MILPVEQGPVTMADDGVMSSEAAIVDQVRACGHAYEQALVDGDGPAAAAWFADVADVSRFGPEGAQLGPEAVRRLRTSYAPVAAPTWLHDAVIVTGERSAVHAVILERGAAVVHRTQIWSLTVDGWRILHAHVSRVPS